MWVREDADLRVSQHESAHKIVLKVTFDRGADWLIRQTSPRFRADLIIEALPEFLLRNERLKHAVP